MPVSPTTTNGFKRRQVYIKKDFQKKFIAKFLFVLLLSGVISVVLTLTFTQGTLTSSFTDSKLTIQNTSLAIMPSVIGTTLVTLFFVSIIVVMVTLLVSHKIAGPMVRFEKDIQRLSTGDLKSRINIRQGDQFQELVISLNTMIDSLNQKVSTIRDNVTELETHEDSTSSCHAEIVLLRERIDTEFKL